MNLASVDDYMSGIKRVSAKYGSRHLGTPGTHQSGDAEDLASAHFKADIRQDGRIQILGITSPAQALDTKCQFPRSRFFTVGKKCGQLTSDHEPDDRFDGRVGDGATADEAAITQHGVPVT